VRVVRVSVLQCFLGGFADHWGCVEIGFVEFQVDDVGFFVFEYLGALEYFDGQEWFDLLRLFGDHGVFWGPCSKLRCRRVARIWVSMCGFFLIMFICESGWFI